MIHNLDIGFLLQWCDLSSICLFWSADGRLWERDIGNDLDFVDESLSLGYLLRYPEPGTFEQTSLHSLGVSHISVDNLRHDSADNSFSRCPVEIPFIKVS